MSCCWGVGPRTPVKISRTTDINLDCLLVEKALLSVVQKVGRARARLFLQHPCHKPMAQNLLTLWQYPRKFHYGIFSPFFSEATQSAGELTRSLENRFSELQSDIKSMIKYNQTQKANIINRTNEIKALQEQKAAHNEKVNFYTRTLWCQIIPPRVLLSTVF